MPNQVFRGGDQPPDEWQQDLRREATEKSQDGQKRLAYDIKELHERFPNLTGEQLRRIPVMPVGMRLEQGSKYIDLQHLERGEFTAGPNEHVSQDNWYVAKTDVDYPLWNYLIGVTDPARLDQDQSAEQL